MASSSAANSYRIADGATVLLLDAGLSYKDLQRALDFQTSQIAGVLVTHEHKDHARAVIDLLKKGVACYMSAGTAEALGVAEHHRTKVVRSKEKVQIGTWTVLPFDVQHDAAEPLGYLLASGREKVLFATDTYYLKYKFPGLTHILLECNYAADILAANIAAGTVSRSLARRIEESHFSLENVKGFFRANDLSAVREIYLLHLSDGNSDEPRFLREIQELTGKMVIVARK